MAKRASLLSLVHIPEDLSVARVTCRDFTEGLLGRGGMTKLFCYQMVEEPLLLFGTSQPLFLHFVISDAPQISLTLEQSLFSILLL